MNAFVLAGAIGGVPAAVCLSSTLLPWPGVWERKHGADLWRVAPNEIALTFDDGPDPIATPRLLDALAAAGVTATFFVVGEKVRRDPALVRQIVAHRHALGNHSHRHETLCARSNAFITDTLLSAQHAVFDACGEWPRWVRPPYGRRDCTFYAVARRLALTPVMWSRDSLDWLGLGAAFVGARLGASRRSDVVLLHDREIMNPRNGDALRRGIARLQARGVSFVTPRGGS